MIKLPLLFPALLFASSICCAAPLAQPQVHTAGRILVDADGWHATWPGVSLLTRFKGRAIGFVIDDPLSSYSVELDGKLRKPLPMEDGEHTVWLRNLTKGAHEIRLTRRNETISAPGTVRRFLLEDGTWLPLKAEEARQIEFIGDSFTVGLANLSKKRSCSGAVIRAKTDASNSFGVQTARHFHAEWEINAMSGMGMNRNWNGNLPGQNFRTYYPRLLQNDEQSKPDNSRWPPQLIVIGLGINDFSTPVHEGEAWTKETLAEEYKTAYLGLLADLRQRYGDVEVLVTAVRIGPDDQQAPLVQQVLEAAHASGDKHIHYLEFGGLELTACQWHPNLADHGKMAKALIERIDELKLMR